MDLAKELSVTKVTRKLVWHVNSNALLYYQTTKRQMVNLRVSLNYTKRLLRSSRSKASWTSSRSSSNASIPFTTERTSLLVIWLGQVKHWHLPCQQQSISGKMGSWVLARPRPLSSAQLVSSQSKCPKYSVRLSTTLWSTLALQSTAVFQSRSKPSNSGVAAKYLLEQQAVSLII